MSGTAFCIYLDRPRTGIDGVYEYIFTPVLGPDAEVQLIAGTTRDITERKSAQLALEQANAQLRAADQQKNHFLAVLSHELRNPLPPIKNSLYVLDRAVPGETRPVAPNPSSSGRSISCRTWSTISWMSRGSREGRSSFSAVAWS